MESYIIIFGCAAFMIVSLYGYGQIDKLKQAKEELKQTKADRDANNLVIMHMQCEINGLRQRHARNNGAFEKHYFPQDTNA